jgi:hypothetical protein
MFVLGNKPSLSVPVGEGPFFNIYFFGHLDWLSYKVKRKKKKRKKKLIAPSFSSSSSRGSQIFPEIRRGVWA